MYTYKYILFSTDHYVPKCRFFLKNEHHVPNWTTLCQNNVDFATIQIHISRDNLSNPLLLEIQVQSIILVSGWSSSCQDYYIKVDKESLITICLDGSIHTIQTFLIIISRLNLFTKVNTYPLNFVCFSDSIL